MERNMDLVRDILIALEKHEHGFAPNPLELPGYTAEQIGFHAHLMIQGGLVTGIEVTSVNSPSPIAIATSLTWEGYEFLSMTESQGNWQKGTGQILSKVGAI